MSSQITVVTGASRGIGRAIAMRLAKEGHFVIGTATTEVGAEAIGSALAEAGLKGVGRSLNVTEADAVDSFIKAVTEEFGAPTKSILSMCL